jgi:endogenous inhibitor of DNA gyrase (YacG/DUF329 family)
MGRQREERKVDDPPSKVLAPNSRILRLLHSPAPSGSKQVHVNSRATRARCSARAAHIALTDWRNRHLKIPL